MTDLFTSLRKEFSPENQPYKNHLQELATNFPPLVYWAVAAWIAQMYEKSVQDVKHDLDAEHAAISRTRANDREEREYRHHAKTLGVARAILKGNYGELDLEKTSSILVKTDKHDHQFLVVDSSLRTEQGLVIVQRAGEMLLRKNVRSINDSELTPHDMVADIRLSYNQVKPSMAVRWLAEEWKKNGLIEEGKYVQLISNAGQLDVRKGSKDRVFNLSESLLLVFTPIEGPLELERYQLTFKPAKVIEPKVVS